jgi:hypothetical protein
MWQAMLVIWMIFRFLPDGDLAPKMQEGTTFRKILEKMPLQGESHLLAECGTWRGEIPLGPERVTGSTDTAQALLSLLKFNPDVFHAETERSQRARKHPNKMPEIEEDNKKNLPA